jgi:hypothetical protein
LVCGLDDGGLEGNGIQELPEQGAKEYVWLHSTARNTNAEWFISLIDLAGREWHLACWKHTHTHRSISSPAENRRSVTHFAAHIDHFFHEMAWRLPFVFTAYLIGFIIESDNRRIDSTPQRGVAQ